MQRDHDTAATGADRTDEDAANRETDHTMTPATEEPGQDTIGVGGIDPADHHGHDDGRDTLTAGEAQRTPGALGTEQVQDRPAMDQNNAPAHEKVAGIVAQTRADLAAQPYERIVEVLRERLVQAGVELPDDDIQELARQAATADADLP